MASFAKAKNGTWTVQLWVKDWSGKSCHKTRSGFATKKEAQAWAEDFKTTEQGSPTMSLAGFYKLYERDVRPRIRESTWATKDSIIRKRILPELGRLPLNKIDPVQVLKWQNGLKAQALSDSYIHTIANQLSALLNHAVTFYGLKSNPQLKVGKPGKADPREMDYWTREEYLKFSEAIMNKPMSYVAFETLYWTGLREGELLALTPEDIDLEKGTISVTKSYQRLKRQDIVGPPKTPKSRRVVVIPEFLVDELGEYIAQSDIAPDQRMFPVTKNYLYHEIDRGSEAAGVKRIRVHDLRHSHVSLLIDEGFNALAIADRVGHEATDITYRYAHLFESKRTEICNALQTLGETR